MVQQRAISFLISLNVTATSDSSHIFIHFVTWFSFCYWMIKIMRNFVEFFRCFFNVTSVPLMTMTHELVILDLVFEKCPFCNIVQKSVKSFDMKWGRGENCKQIAIFKLCINYVLNGIYPKWKPSPLPTRFFNGCIWCFFAVSVTFLNDRAHFSQQVQHLRIRTIAFDTLLKLHVFCSNLLAGEIVCFSVVFESRTILDETYLDSLVLLLI